MNVCEKERIQQSTDFFSGEDICLQTMYRPLEQKNPFFARADNALVGTSMSMAGVNCIFIRSANFILLFIKTKEVKVDLRLLGKVLSCL